MEFPESFMATLFPVRTVVVRCATDYEGNLAIVVRYSATVFYKNSVCTVYMEICAVSRLSSP